MKCGKLQIIDLENISSSFHSKLHIESLYISHERQIYLFVCMLSTYSVLNKYISKPLEI